jgi:NADH:ubiquinone reductase (H+-translocating)
LLKTSCCGLDGKEQQPFRYHDRGIMATIGRTRAVAWPFYRVQLTGFLAWVVWLALHLLWLMGFRNRLTVFINWVWNYLTYDRSVRIILERGFSSGDTPEATMESGTMPDD